jgi:hypothetical protein
VKSQELHRHLQVALGGWFRAHGFVVARRTPLAWYRQPLLVWIQLHPHGWDPHSGSSFYVNFQTGSAQAWDGPMRRLQEFLTDEELEEMRALHNRVIPKLTLPPREHLQALTAFFTKGSPDAESIIDAYLSNFKPAEIPYQRHHDVSLNYWDGEDAQRWGAFLLRVMPRIVSDCTDHW